MLKILNEILSVLTPPPLLKVSEWADRFRKLSPEASAMPGKWQTAVAEYQRGMMDAMNEPGIETIVCMTSSQVGKTEIVNNVVGYIISQDPAPILVVQPTLEMAQTWSKDRFSPMMRDTEILHGYIKPSKSKNSNNTILHKTFPGGHITIAGANSPASLASRPIRVVLCDEVDRFPPSAGTEGDPVALAVKRSTTFWNRVIFLISTPTVKDLSRIEAAWKESDQRRFFVPCPDCGKFQYLIWGQVKWEKDKDGQHLPETTYYECEYCGAQWDDRKRMLAIRKGEWRKTATSRNKVAGFHIWEAYSPWVQLSELVSNFLDSKDSPERLKVFINTSLGETYEDEGLQVDELELYTRREKYPAEVPAGGLVLTCGVDTQDDRLEGEICAWGMGEESWSVDYFIIYGDPAREEIWADLDRMLQRTFKHESGIMLRISCTCIDSGGHYTEQVYRFCKGKDARRVFATKGSNAVGRPLISRPSKSNKARIKLFLIGTDTAKEILFARMQIDEPGPGFMHFPLKEIYEREYFEQLTAEKAKTKYTRGFPHRVWVKTRARNEALDCRILNMAALAILNPNFEKISESFEKISGEVENIAKAQGREKPKLGHPKKGWVNKWK